ncbi:formyltransferase family protein [Halorientalis litorea]|uniref:formyltransferase family protein n=1 Tax=Halorientalis litorea TaxID=2931977 RepID=UPI001FF11A08|nr:formyltransferase family protein [Halorientalis litorea]
MTDDSTPLQVGLLCDGRHVQRWVARTLDHMLTHTDAEISVIVVNTFKGQSESRSSGKVLSEVLDNGLWTLVVGTRKLANALGHPPEYIEKHKRDIPLSEVDGIDQTSVVETEPVDTDGFGKELPDEVVDMLAEETDVVVRFGFGFLKGRILEAPEHGALSFHGGDLREYRGKPPGFWEFMNDKSHGGFVLQRITEKLDGGQIVTMKTVDLSDARTWQEVKLRLYDASEDMLTDGIRNISDPDFEPADPESLGNVYSTPSGRVVVSYLLKNSLGRVRGLM